MTSTGRYQPYGMPRSRSNEHGNAEAGPSTLQSIPYLGPTTLQPSGRTKSETTANAEPTQTISEEDKITVSNFYCSHIPHVTEWSFGDRRLSGPSDRFAATARR